MALSEVRLAGNFAVWSGVLAFASFAVAVTAIVALHMLRPEWNPFVRTLSSYVAGPNGWLMTVVFFAMALGFLSLGAGLFWTLGDGAPRLKILALFLVASAGTAVAGIFPADVNTPVQSVHGFIHNNAILPAFVTAGVGVSLSARAMLSDARWDRFRKRGGKLALAVVVSLTVFLLVYELDLPLRGLFQRAPVFLGIAWFLQAAWGMVRMGRGEDRFR